MKTEIRRCAVVGTTVLSMALSVTLLPASSESAAVGSERPTEGKLVVGAEGAEVVTVDSPRLARLLQRARYSPGVTDVAEMAAQGTDAKVLSAFVEASDETQRLRAEDIAYLREREVPDEVISEMIARRSENRGQQREARASVEPPLPVVGPPLAAKVTVVPAPQPRQPRPSTVTVIGRSDARGGLSYRNYYYSPRNAYSPRRYSSVYASYGNYGHPGRRVGGYYGYPYRVYRPYGSVPPVGVCR